MLVKELRKNTPTVSRWCTLEPQPSLKTLVVIAEIHEVKMKDLLNSTGKKA